MEIILLPKAQEHLDFWGKTGNKIILKRIALLTENIIKTNKTKVVDNNQPSSILETIPIGLILDSTKEGDVVLDPFTGSSTTGLAAIKNGRKFVGIDSEKKYLETSKKRFEELKNIKLS